MNKKPITFKQAFVVVITIHAVGFSVLFFNERPNVLLSKSAQSRSETYERSPRTFPLDKNVPIVTEHAIQPGENFYIISKKVNVPFAELAAYNNITDPRFLKIGQIIKVPKKTNI